MANDKETMRQRLRDALFDIEDETWNAGEKDDLLGMAVRRLSRRLSRPIDPTASSSVSDVTLATGDYHYAIDSANTRIDKVLYINTSSDYIGYLASGWEVYGDLDAGTGVLHVSPQVVEQGGTLRLVGAGRYTLPALGASQATAILDDHVPLVLAWAQEGAWRRLLSDRARFRQWQTSNQVQNVSVNEIVQMIQDAARQADEEWALLRKWQQPVLGRV
jgi:hypothetical protein